MRTALMCCGPKYAVSARVVTVGRPETEEKLYRRFVREKQIRPCQVICCGYYVNKSSSQQRYEAENIGDLPMKRGEKEGKGRRDLGRRGTRRYWTTRNAERISKRVRGQPAIYFA